MERGQGAHLEYWGLEGQPFDNVPNPDGFLLFQCHKVALGLLDYVVKERKAVALLTGEYGTGKTTLIRLLLGQMNLDGVEVAVLDYPLLEGEGLYRRILEQIGGAPPGSAGSELHQALGSRLLEHARQGKHTLVVFDEAQLMPVELLEEIRLLLNYQLNDRNLVSLILVGQDELWSKLSKMPHFSQRIAVKCHLEKLDEHEAIKYIYQRLERCGGRAEIFSERALGLIHEQSEGVPRRINTICDLALVVGSYQAADVIDAEVLECMSIGAKALDFSSPPSKPRA